jgi:aminopeptidase N
LELTERPGPDSQGWPGLIFLSNYVYMTPEELKALHTSPAEELIYREVMLRHEIAHQWFGDKISWASYHEQWLMEALSNYCALMLLERTRPADVEVVLDAYRRSLAARSRSGQPFVEAGPVTLGVRLSSSQFHNGYEFITYGRGTWLIHMLRTMLRDASRTAENPAGDDKAFLALLRGLVDQYQGKEITNAEFQRAVEQVLPRSLWYENQESLDWFFDGWINGTAFPHLELSDVKNTTRGGVLTFAGVIRQKPAPFDLVTSVPVYGLAGERKLYLGRVFAEGEETRFSMEAPAGVKRLLLDPYQTILTAP